MIFPPNVFVPQEYRDLSGAIGLVNGAIEQLRRDDAVLDEYNLPEGMEQRLRECIEWRILGLNTEKQRYIDRQHEIEHELMGDIPD